MEKLVIEMFRYHMFILKMVNPKLMSLKSMNRVDLVRVGEMGSLMKDQIYSKLMIKTLVVTPEFLNSIINNNVNDET